MIIIETSIFSRRLQDHLSDDEYRGLQAVLAVRSDAGALIPGSGGLRKIRWVCEGHGKRGGVRVIYYWAVELDRILLLILRKKRTR
jgi:mRNA-degrading endonuclease RelE of RelBE toxin-antitoxin system